MFVFFFFFKQKTAYEMRISDWSSDVCSSDLGFGQFARQLLARARAQPKDAADGFLHRKVARGPDVGAAFGEEQVDFGRPAPETLDAREQGDRILLVGGEIGRAAGRESVGRYVENSGEAVS